MRRIVLLVLWSGAVWAGEYAVLASGFRLRVESHVTDGAVTTLHHRNGTMVVATGQILGFEVEDYVAPPPQPEPPASPQPSVSQLVEQAAQRHGVSPALVSSVIAAESGYHAGAVSPKGAMGLMQLMPATASDLKVSNPFDPGDNINGGTAYLRQMLDRYAGFRNQLGRALAAYNAGPGKVDLYGGLPPYRETNEFVSRVMRQMERRKAGR